MIEVKGLSFKYTNALAYAIQDASFAIDAVGTIAIVGKSGTGKSTLLGLISGIYGEQDQIVGSLQGSITLNGRRPDQIRGPQVVSWVPQEPALLDHLTVFQNIMLPLTISQVKSSSENECLGMLDRLEMVDKRSARPRELSGGMKTRVSIMRALISQPQYLFLDEPFISLDVENRWNMYRLLQDERKRQSSRGMCTFITTHDIPEAMLLSDTIIIMSASQGRTSFEFVRNTPLNLNDGTMGELLFDARSRAPQVERRIYSQT